MSNQLEFDFKSLKEKVMARQEHVKHVLEELRNFRDKFNLGVQGNPSDGIPHGVNYSASDESWNYDMLDVAIDLIEEMDTLFIEALKESELVGSILNKMNQR